jgi:CDP-diacylglycerol--serine O-phosphatidyltransferase
LLTFEFGPGIYGNGWLVGLWTAAVGALMFSTLPTFSLKRIRIPQAAAPFLLVGVGVFATALATNTWAALVWMGFAYLVSLPISIWWVRRKLDSIAAEPAATKAPDGQDAEAESPVPGYIHMDEAEDENPPSIHPPSGRLQ